MKENKRPTIRMKDLTQEEKDRLFGFFELLLKVDMRNNPNRYKKPMKTK